MRYLFVTLLLALSLIGAAVHATGLASGPQAWREAGFDADDARLWQRAGYSATEAAAWKRLVTSYRHAGRNNLQEAEIWRGWGYTLREAQHFLNDLGGRFRQAEEMARRHLSVTETLNALRHERGLAPLPEPGLQCPRHHGQLTANDDQRPLRFRVGDDTYEVLERRQRETIDGVTRYYFSWENVNRITVSFRVDAEGGFAMYDAQQDQLSGTATLAQAERGHAEDLPPIEVHDLEPGDRYGIELWLPDGGIDAKERDAIGRIRYPDQDCRRYDEPVVDVGEFEAHQATAPTQPKGGGGKGAAAP
jgi:hypothetical protein